MTHDNGMIDDPGLFELEAPPPVSLADKFGVPPFSVLDRRSGEWQDRKRRWLTLGIQSEVGRDGALTYAKGEGLDPVSQKLLAISGGTSVFDPVVCELVYRWFTGAGDRVLDPFAGGSVRGIVASTLGRHYVGVDLRPEQVVANRAQSHLGSSIQPVWVEGDATALGSVLAPAANEVDLVFSCPPYADLEVYSDDPRDLSTMGWDEFVTAHAAAIGDSVRTYLAPDRFAAWVISDVRAKDGTYRGLVHETVAAFRAAGARLVNDFVIVDPVATAAIRAERPFRASRKATRVHQHLLVFVKGDLKRAAARVEAADKEAAA